LDSIEKGLREEHSFIILASGCDSR
jgi:hypothetical protein